MARFLALDWDAGHLHLAVGSVTKGVLKLEKALAWPEEQPPAPANAEALGQRLRDHLREAHIATAPLLVAVGRDRLVLKEVKHPIVPPHEEPALVRFQAVKELTEAAEDIVIDYQPGEEPAGERRSLVVALRRDAFKAYQTLATAAGLRLVAVVPRAYGVIAAIRQSATPPEPGTAFAALTESEKGGEFVVARGDRLSFARAVAGQALASDNALLGEMRRNLAVYAGQAPAAPVRALYVAEGSGPAPGVRDRLRDTLAIPVHSFDPLAGLAELPSAPRGAFAGLVGLILLQGRGRELPINFVKPREPKPPADPNRRTVLIGSAVAAAVLLALVSFAYARLAAKDRQLAEVRGEIDDLTAQLTQLAPEETRINAIDDWTSGQVVWLDELYDLTARFPDVNRMRATTLEAVRPNQGGAAKLTPSGTAARTAKAPKAVAKLKIKGIATDSDRTTRQLTTEFSKDTSAYYPKGLDPLSTGPNRMGGADRRQFPIQFDTAIEVAKRPPDKYVRKLTAPPPPRKDKPGQGEGFLLPGGAP